jgi:hypothetical protein
MKVKIANPIYDVMFKYLMDDMESAKIIISTIINREILSLESQPQEHIIKVEKYGFTIFRVDFKAIVKTETGSEKILIEMQKAKNPADIFRFRRYIGENYKSTDLINNVETNLPMTCIYFIGYNVPFENILIYIPNTAIDSITGEVITEKLDILELLNHNSHYIFMSNLPKSQQENVIYDILDIFDQSKIIDNGNRQFLEIEFDENTISPKKKQLIMRLHQASLEADLLEKAKNEELYNRDLENIFRKFEFEKEAERAKAEQERANAEHERAKAEQERKMKIEAQKREQDALQREQEAKLKIEAIQKENEELRKLLNK